MINSGTILTFFNTDITVLLKMLALSLDQLARTQKIVHYVIFYPVMSFNFSDLFNCVYFYYIGVIIQNIPEDSLEMLYESLSKD